MEKRDLYVRVWQELSEEKSMVFLAGPRQAGKTTLSRIVADTFTNKLYFNWDIPDHRTEFLSNRTFFERVERRDSSVPLIVLDEIHKYKDWKNYLKGMYDQFHETYKFLVSGSGRLDLYQKGGDSLAGRYFLFHLWPFTIAEFGNKNSEIRSFLADPLRIEGIISTLPNLWKRLSLLSGFPEPFLSGRETTYRRWSNSYASQLIREDIRDLSEIRSVADLETLYLLLPARIGSPLSMPSLAQDLKVSYNTIRNWLEIFERFFLAFSITTWTKRISRAIQKERKFYLWDTPRIKDPAARFENMVALELYRAVTLWNDRGFGNFSLHFLRNKEKQEVDFLIADNGEPLLLVEAKLTDKEPSETLMRFQRAIKVPAVQLFEEGDSYRLISNDSNKLLISPACQWLAGLP